MNKIKKITFGVMTLSFSLFLGLASLVGIRSATAPKTMQAKAAGQTGLDLVVVGYGVEKVKYLGGNGWSNEYDKVTLKEIDSGIYTGTFFTTGGGFTILQKGTWGPTRFGFDALDDSTDKTHFSTGDGGQNVDVNNFRGMLRLTVDTNKDSKQLHIQELTNYTTPTISGPGAKDCVWNCDSYTTLFDTEDAVVYTTKMTSSTASSAAENRWIIVGYQSAWDKWANWENVNQNSPAIGDFSDGSSHDIQSNKGDTDYLIKLDTADSNKVTIFYANNAHKITYYDGLTVLGSDVAEGGKTYTPYHFKNSDVNKKLVGYYTDSSFTTPFDPDTPLASGSADIDLFAKYEDYSFDVYFSTGITYKWDGGVNIYAWDSNNQSVIGEWPGQEMTYLGGNLCKFTFVGEQNPAGVKFSEKGNDGNQTGDVNFPDGKNVYVYEAAHRGLSDGFAVYDENMMKAEEFAKRFIAATDAGCTSKSFDATTWATVKSAVQGLLDDEDALEVFLDNNGLYKTLGLDDDFIDEALRRYDIIVRKYNVEDFFNRGVSLYSHTIFSAFINNESIPMFIVVVVSAACIGLFFIRRRKETK